MILTKSDFKACVDCPTRLHYRKTKGKFPSSKDDNEYLQFLADGGFMVEFLAKARYPNGVDLVDLRSPAEAFEATKKALCSADKIAVFEAAANSGAYHVRTDILLKEGKELHLIEVKSSSIDAGNDDDEEHDSDDDKNDVTDAFFTKRNPRRVTAKWLPYLQDLTFQTIVLEAAFPEYVVRPFLAVIDKSQVATAAETLDQFTLVSKQTGPADKRPRPEVAYKGNLAELAASKLIVAIEAKEAVEFLRESVSNSAAVMAKLLTADGADRATPNLADLYRKCRKCEFRVTGQSSGFDICWAGFPTTESHILDFHRVGQIGLGPKDPIPGFLAAGRISYLDLTTGQMGNPGAWATRRLRQWEGMKAKVPSQDPALRKILESHTKTPGYPFHFIDFEACNISLPHHVGLNPYERVAFQWSCHTVDSKGDVDHRGWLNDQRAFPNFDFARSLRKQIGDHGTVYVWSNYEQVTLRKIMKQLQAAESRKLGNHDPELAAWIAVLLGPKDDEDKYRNSPRIRDLHDLTYDHYFHPHMQGRTSIKVVLPAVWQSDAKLRAHPLFAEYAKGQTSDPYKALQALPLTDASAVVQEGTGAVRVYQDLIFSAEIADRANRRQLLEQYCQLDTAAMLMIWMHWLGRYDLHPVSLSLR